MKRIRIIAGIAIALLLLASLVAWYLQPSPVAVARAHCLERGVQAEDLALAGYRSSGSLFGKQGAVEFHLRGATPPRKLVVELHQPVYFLAWQVVDARDEVEVTGKLEFYRHKRFGHSAVAIMVGRRQYWLDYSQNVKELEGKGNLPSVTVVGALRFDGVAGEREAVVVVKSITAGK